MNSFRIQADIQRHLIYFYDAKEYEDKKPIDLQKLTEKEKKRRGGLHYVDFSLFQHPYSIFTSAISYFFAPNLPLMEKKNGPIYYVPKKSLDHWIWDRLNVQPSGNYEEDIQKICKKNLNSLENGPLTFKRSNESSVIYFNPTKSISINHSEYLKWDRHCRPDCNPTQINACSIFELNDDIPPPNNPEESVIPEFYESDSLSNRLNESSHKKSVTIPTIEIDIDGIVISARYSLLETSGIYFRNFPLYGERSNDVTKMSISSFNFEDILIDDECKGLNRAIDIIKNYLEGRDFEGRDFLIPDLSTQFELTPMDYLYLFSFQNTVFDISGILQTAIQSLDFYSNELLIWNGKKITRLSFYYLLKELYPGPYFLKDIPKHRILSAIQMELKETINKPNSCEFNYYFHRNKSLNLKFKFTYDENYYNGTDSYYSDYFSFLLNLNAEQSKELNISSITIDLKDLNSHTPDYFIRLIREINGYINSLNGIELIITGGSYKFFLLSNLQHLQFVEILNNLFATDHKVVFNQIEIRRIDENDPKFLHTWQKTLADLFHSLINDNSSIKALYTFLPHAVTFSGSLSPSQNPKRKIEASYTGNSFNIYSHFSLIQPSFHLILNQNNIHKKPWNVIDLHKLTTIHKLTVKNTEINKVFYIILQTIKNNLKSINKTFYCKLSRCVIEDEIAESLNHFIEENNKTYSDKKHMKPFMTER